MEAASDAAEAALASKPTRDPRRTGLKGCTSLHLVSQPIDMGLISLIGDWSTIIFWLMFFVVLIVLLRIYDQP